MTAARVPKDIRQFVARFLPRVEHLEVLMILQRAAARSWSPSEIAAWLRIPESTAADVLEQLALDNFLDVKISNEILYRFKPATADLVLAVADCAEFYQRERTAMIDAVLMQNTMQDLADT